MSAGRSAPCAPVRAEGETGRGSDPVAALEPLQAGEQVEGQPAAELRARGMLPEATGPAKAEEETDEVADPRIVGRRSRAGREIEHEREVEPRGERDEDGRKPRADEPRN